jgi:tetratricopeptide (TPR) repeat protein
MVAVQEWRKQPSRRIEEIRRELEALIGELSAYVRESPALPQGYYVRARAHFSSGDLAAAEADLTRALDREPDFTPGWALLAQLKMERYMNRLYAWSHRERLARRQESEPVLREAEEAMRRWASGKSSSDRWGLSWTREDTIHEILILALRERYVEGNREAAVERLKKAHSESPAAEFCDFLGNWAGEVEPAEKWLDQAIAIAPHWERPYLDRGVVRSVKKERERAIADFTRAIEINPNCVMAYDNRAVQRFHLGDLDRAIEDCTRALTLDPRLDSGLLHRAEAWCRKGEFRKAVQDCTEAIALRPAVPGPYGIRGFSLLQMGEFDRAAPDLERAIELEPEEPLHYLRRAFLFFARKDFARAARDCEKCLQLAPPEWEHRAVIQDLLEKARRS